MKRFLRAIAILLVPLLASCAGQTPRPVVNQPTPLLLVSIDAYRADYLARGLSPTLQSLADTGVRAVAMEPAFPSLTFPNHYTLVTGLYPDHHGIIGNTMHDAKLGRFSLGKPEAVRDGRWWDEAEPLWVTADKAGLKTATMFWPGSEAEIHGHRPDDWRPYDGKVTADRRVDQILAWLDLPAGQRPTFLTLYFDDVDHAGHAAGPDSKAVDHALSVVDEAMQRLVAGLRARHLYNGINIVVVSDHGMAAVGPKNNVLVDKLINLDHVHVVSSGIVAGYDPKPGYAAEVRAKLLQPHPHMQCWDKAHIPARFHYGSNPRVPAITCLANLHWNITSSDWLAKSKRPPLAGNHGYDNADPLMRAIFIAHGPTFRSGLVVPEFPNVDVYPLLTHLLGIRARPNDGNYATVEDMLKPAAR